MRAIYDYIIYTDGGCECNPGGRGGYGAVIINNNTGELTDISGGFRSTTNNRMEVMAVIKALEKIEKDTHIQLFSDSQYVIKTMNGMFRKKKNMERQFQETCLVILRVEMICMTLMRLNINHKLNE